MRNTLINVVEKHDSQIFRNINKVSYGEASIMSPRQRVCMFHYNIPYRIDKLRLVL